MTGILYKMYNFGMKILSTTDARKNIKELVERAQHKGEVFGIGRRGSVDALIIGFPAHYHSGVNDITNVNAHSQSFAFLSEEPDLYSAADTHPLQ